MPETDRFPRSRVSQSALGKVPIDSTSSWAVLSRGTKLTKKISDWKTSTLTELVNTRSLDKIVYVKPVILDVAMMVMLTSDSVKVRGTVPIKAGGGEGLILTHGTGGLVVTCKVSSGPRRKSVRLTWKSPPRSTGTEMSDPAKICRLNSFV